MNAKNTKYVWPSLLLISNNTNMFGPVSDWAKHFSPDVDVSDSGARNIIAKYINN